MIHCGTNNIQNDVRTVIINKIKSLIDELRKNNPTAIILVSDILARPKDHATSGVKVIDINNALRIHVPLWGCKLVASHKLTFKNNKPVADLYDDGLHLNQKGSIKLRQFINQRLAEFGTKPVNQCHNATYLRRSQWSKNLLHHVHYNY
jgi:lysophospholipase L1-like esterase